MSRNESGTDAQERAASVADPACVPAPKPSVPAPARTEAALAVAHDLTDHTDELTEIGQIPLEGRATVLTAIHEELASVLHKAEG